GEKSRASTGAGASRRSCHRAWPGFALATGPSKATGVVVARVAATAALAATPTRTPRLKDMGGPRCSIGAGGGGCGSLLPRALRGGPCLVFVRRPARSGPGPGRGRARPGKRANVDPIPARLPASSGAAGGRLGEVAADADPGRPDHAIAGPPPGAHLLDHLAVLALLVHLHEVHRLVEVRI